MLSWLNNFNNIGRAEQNNGTPMLLLIYNADSHFHEFKSRNLSGIDGPPAYAAKI